MKNWKKTALTIGSYAAVAALAIGGTMAYLTDAERNVNTFTMGDVDIEQHEYERVLDENGNGISYDASSVDPNYGITKSYELQEFTNGKPALPAVYTNEKKSTAWEDVQQLWNQAGAPGSNDIFDDSMKNVLDKFVFVENTGKTDAYYRTIIAIETPEGTESLLHLNLNTNNRFDAITQSDDFNGTADKGIKSYFVDYITIDGIRYGLYDMTYNEVLTPGEVSRPSLLQVYLDPKTTNSDCEKFGETWDVLVVSQAVQVTEGISANDMLDEAFGDITATTHPWANTIDATDASAFKTAISEGGNVAVTGNIDLTPGADEEITGNVVSQDTVLDFNENAGITYNVLYENGMNGTQISALTVVDDADLTIIDGNLSGSEYGIYAKDGTVTINGGSYKGKTSAIQAASGGTVYISGGYFEATGSDSRYVLNCIDAAYKDGTAKIVVTGGTFKNFNPNEVIGSEDYVPDGYKVISEEIDGDTYYTVVAE